MYMYRLFSCNCVLFGIDIIYVSGVMLYVTPVVGVHGIGNNSSVEWN